MDVKETYAAWHAKTNKDMAYVDSESFQEFFEKEKAASVKRNETIKAEEEAAKKKAEEEAAKKEDAEKPAEEEDKPAEEEEKPAEEEEKPAEEEESLAAVKEDKKPKEYAWAELDNLHNAGVAFDDSVQNSVMNLAAGELKLAGKFYPEIVAKLVEDGDEGVEGYKSIAEHSEVPIEEYSAAVLAVQKAKFDFITLMNTKDGLKQFKADPNFKAVYLRAIARFKGIPSQTEMEERLKMHQNPDDKFTPFLKTAVDYIKAISEPDRLEANKLFGVILDKIGEWAKAGKAMDDKLLDVKKTMEIHHTGQVVQDAGAHVTDAITQRRQLYKVWKALGNLNEIEEVAMAEAAKYQKQVDDENKANVALIIILVLLALLSIGGVVYCKVAKKCCFAEKEEGEEGVQAEGGVSDKALFKKSKKNKTQKDALIPSFQVADEQA